MRQQGGMGAFSSGRVYDNDDLRICEAVIEGVLADLRADGSYLGEPANVREVRIRLAAAVLPLYDRGERDPARMRRLALAALVGPGPAFDAKGRSALL